MSIWIFIEIRDKQSYNSRTAIWIFTEIRDNYVTAETADTEIASQDGEKLFLTTSTELWDMFSLVD